MANQDIPNGFKFAYAKNNAAPPNHPYLVDASQAIAKGDMVMLNANGFVVIATAAATKILGIAAHAIESAAGDQTQILNVQEGLADVVFEGQCSGTPPQSLIGGQCDIEGATGAMEINEDAAVTKVIKVLAFHPSDIAGANRRVRFTIHPAASQLLTDK